MVYNNFRHRVVRLRFKNELSVRQIANRLDVIDDMVLCALEYKPEFHDDGRLRITEKSQEYVKLLYEKKIPYVEISAAMGIRDVDVANINDINNGISANYDPVFFERQMENSKQSIHDAEMLREKVKNIPFSPKDE